MLIQSTHHAIVSALSFLILLHILTLEAAIRATLIDAVGKSMTLAKDAQTALNGNDPNVNELKGWFFAGYRLDLVKGKVTRHCISEFY